MLFTTFVFAVFASFLAIAQAASNSCPAGSILGIYAMCGTAPVDCGKGLCCLNGQKCVSGGCTDPKLTDDSGKVLTVNAACYGTLLDHQTPPSSSVTSAPASIVTNPSTIATPTPNHVASSSPSASGGASPSSGSGTATSSTGLAVSTGAASSFTSTQQSTFALMLSAVAAVAFWL